MTRPLAMGSPGWSGPAAPVTESGDQPGGNMTTVHDTRPVCLVRPPTVETFRFATTSITPPLGLAFIAGALEAAGEQVDVVDAVAEAPETFRRYFKGYLIGLPFDEIAPRIPADAKLDRHLGDLHARVAGRRAADRAHQAPLPRHADRARRRARHVDARVLPAHVRADFLVLGEGEETIVELIDALDAGHARSTRSPASRFRDRRRRRRQPRRERTLAVDDIAWPAWHHIDLDTYHERRWMGGMYTSTKSVPILATRGCPYQCTYCSSPNMWTPRWIPRDPSRSPTRSSTTYEDLRRRGTSRSRTSPPSSSAQWIIDFCTRAARPRPRHHLADAVGHALRGDRRRGRRAAQAHGHDQHGLRARVRLRGDPQAHQEEDERPTACSRACAPRWRPTSTCRSSSSSGSRTTPTTQHPREPRRSSTSSPRSASPTSPSGSTWRCPARRSSTASTTAGKINLDRTYFRHILASTSLWSTSTYCGS